MKLIKKIVKRTYRFVKRYRYICTGLFISLFLTWLFCLPDELFEKPTSTVLYDKEGQLLGASIAEDGQWRFPYNPVVPEKFKIVITQFEDRNFYVHQGVSFRGLARAVYQNLSEGERVSGGSTITMQLMRMSRERQSRSYWQKCVEIFWATRAEWRYSKDEIIAMYASNAPMGGNVVGLDAAAWRYFGRPANQLSWAETATLAVLPNAPSLMHPGRNRDLLKQKRNRLLNRLYEIKVIDSVTWILSKYEDLPEAPHPIPRLAPQLLTRAIKDGKKGQVIQSTIDIHIQEQTNAIIKRHHEQLRENQIFNAAALVMDVETGEIIAYTGNVPDLEKEHGSDVDIIMAPRSSGSILKPFLYAAMLENGLITPKMFVQDIPTVMSGYSPKNYNLKFDGMVNADDALARSLNVPMVRMLTKYGTANFHNILHQLEFTTINRSPSHYGLSLILGGAEVNLWDLVSAYGVMARTLNGYRRKMEGVNRKASYTSQSETYDRQKPVFNAATCYYTFKAMREVKRPEEDINWELFSSAQQISWKTGTSFGFRDAWAVGTNSRYVVGVWVGNADGEGRPGLVGRRAAAPILFDIFSSLPASEWFQKPTELLENVEVCSKTGYRATEACQNTDIVGLPFASLNTTSCPYHEFIFLDSTGERRVSASCYSLSKAVKASWFTLPAVAEYYYKNHDPNYQPLPAYKAGCANQEEERQLAIIYPKNKSQIYIPVNFNEEYEKVFFEATHVHDDALLFWHLNDNYLGTTQRIHQVEFMPPPGDHTLKIVDENGVSDVVAFSVVVRDK